MVAELKTIKCSNKKCNKVVGEIEHGHARFKCKTCGHYTTVTIEHTTEPPASANRSRTVATPSLK